MNYIDWCETVLTTFFEECRNNLHVRDNGIYPEMLEKIIWGEDYDRIRAKLKEDKTLYVTDDAFVDLKECRLVEERDQSNIFKLTLRGKQVAAHFPSFYQSICTVPLSPVQASSLEVLAELTTREDDHYAHVVECDVGEVHERLRELGEGYSDLSSGDVDQVVTSLRHHGLVFCELGDYLEEVRINFEGLVWVEKQHDMVDYREIDQLVQDGETAYVDLKRELFLDTSEQKAEFIKDLNGLANTKVTGSRWLVIGIDEKTGTVHIPEGKAWHESLTLERMEQLISHYAEPHINIRYKLSDYRGGKAALIEVRRDARNLPYKVKADVGDKKRIRVGDIFVRHGTLTVRATDIEIKELEEEAQRAKSRDI